MGERTEVAIETAVTDAMSCITQCKTRLRCRVDWSAQIRAVSRTTVTSLLKTGTSGANCLERSTCFLPSGSNSLRRNSMPTYITVPYPIAGGMQSAKQRILQQAKMETDSLHLMLKGASNCSQYILLLGGQTGIGSWRIYLRLASS